MRSGVFVLLLTPYLLGIEAQDDTLDDKLTPMLSCECVPYYLCNQTFTTDPVGLLDIRIPESCESYLQVCCDQPNRLDEPTVKPPTPEPKTTCGYRNIDGIGFKITGYPSNETQYGEFPWVVAILTEEFRANNDITLSAYKCGGALIHPEVVLTAAHCVASQKKKYKVRAGEWDTQTTKEIYRHQDRYVKSVVIHSNYTYETLMNDVAIVFLESPLKITENVNTVCLPEPNIEVTTGTRCFATGWGKDVFGNEGKYQVVLKKIDLPMVNHSACQEQLRTTQLGKRFQLDKSFVCAGGEGQDTCKGDGGSPLMCPIPGEQTRYQQVGMVAWGLDCGESKIPGVYVNIGLFRHWIDEQFASYGLSVSSYNYNYNSLNVVPYIK